MAVSAALAAIGECILDESRLPADIQRALEDFTGLCTGITGIEPDPGFSAWAGDALLPNGVAINPAAAAHCISDYRRSAMFIRGLYAALAEAAIRFPDTRLRVLYAGCGPFATLLLPLLGRFDPHRLDISLLDVHRESLDSVGRLVSRLGLADYRIEALQEDATRYRHPQTLHVIVTETMQKALEQEPQFAVTANLAPQLHPGGMFLPGEIELELCLARPAVELELFERDGKIDAQALTATGERRSLGVVFRLLPERAAAQLQEAKADPASGGQSLPAAQLTVPDTEGLADLEALLFTRVQVFDRYWLRDYEAQITLPRRCPELSPLVAGDCWQTRYQLGGYPRFEFTRTTRYSSTGSAKART